MGIDKIFGAARVHQSPGTNTIDCTRVLDFSRVGGVEEETVVTVGYANVVALLCSDRLLTGLDLQTLAKCPFFQQLRQTASLAGHL